MAGGSMTAAVTSGSRSCSARCRAPIWPLRRDRSLHRDGLPGFIGVEAAHRGECGCGARAEILLVHHAVLADDECLHAGDGVFRWGGRQREAADHGALDDVVQPSEGRCRTLPGEDLEVVAVIRLAAFRVALRDRAGDAFTHRSIPRAVRCLPRQTVLLSRCADDPLRVLVDLVALAPL